MAEEAATAPTQLAMPTSSLEAHGMVCLVWASQNYTFTLGLSKSVGHAEYSAHIAWSTDKMSHFRTKILCSWI